MALSGTKNALSGARMALSGTKNALSGANTALSGTRNALSGAPHAAATGTHGGARMALSGA
eukprot:8162981-Pyramimonas_sp.AAC.1